MTNSHDDLEQTPFAPEEALASVDSSRAAIAERFRSPWWYHWGLGAIIAALIFSMANDLDTVPSLTVVIVSLAALGLLVLAFRRTTGMWWGPKELGPSSRRTWFLYMGVMILALVAASLMPKLIDGPGNLAASIALALTTGALAVAAGYRIDTRLREEIRAGITTPTSAAAA